MRKARWLAEWRMAAGKPVLYHVHSRVVDRRFVLGTEEKEKFRTYMRMQENFTGCRALSYCLMDNHFHILLEVPPMADGGITDEVLLKRLSAIYGEAFVAGIAQELADARKAVYMTEGRTFCQYPMTERRTFCQSPTFAPAQAAAKIHKLKPLGPSIPILAPLSLAPSRNSNSDFLFESDLRPEPDSISHSPSIA